jgi:hypothetical protein
MQLKFTAASSGLFSVCAVTLLTVCCTPALCIITLLLHYSAVDSKFQRSYVNTNERAGEIRTNNSVPCTVVNGEVSNTSHSISQNMSEATAELSDSSTRKRSAQQDALTRISARTFQWQDN